RAQAGARLTLPVSARQTWWSWPTASSPAFSPLGPSGPFLDRRPAVLLLDEVVSAAEPPAPATHEVVRGPLRPHRHARERRPEEVSEFSPVGPPPGTLGVAARLPRL